MSEALLRMQQLADEFGARVAAVAPDAWDNQSPCDEWKARDVVGHVSANCMRLVGALGGQVPEAAADNSDPVGMWSGTHAALSAAVTNAIDTKMDLSANVPGPFGPMSVEDLAGRIMSTDVLVHTWDLARSVGGDEKLDEAAVAGGYSGLKPLDTMIRRPGIFADKLDAPAAADLQTEFLAFLGRKV